MEFDEPEKAFFELKTKSNKLVECDLNREELIKQITRFVKSEELEELEEPNGKIEDF